MKSMESFGSDGAVVVAVVWAAHVKRERTMNAVLQSCRIPI